jgi:hypothetical protein
MIDLDKLSALEKAAKPAPWYAWLHPTKIGISNVEDKCITTVSEEQYLQEYNDAEEFNKELAERIGKNTISYDWKYRGLTDDEEVVGCSEWMRAENEDFLLIVEMRNQLPELIAHIKALEREFLKSAYEHNKVSHGHAWYPGDEDYNEYLKRVDADAHKKAQEALDGVLAGARRQLKEEHPELF